MKKLVLVFVLISLLAFISCNPDDTPPPEVDEFTGAGIFRCKINREPFEMSPCNTYMASFELQNFIVVSASDCEDLNIQLTVLELESEKLSNGVYPVTPETDVYPRGGVLG